MSKKKYQHRFSINVWCGVIGDRLIGQYIFTQRLTGDTPTCLQHELQDVSENILLQTRRQLYYQHDETLPHYYQIIRRYLTQRFPNRWIGCSGTEYWPPRSPYLNPLDYHVSG